jgi:hypothetical protein
VLLCTDLHAAHAILMLTIVSGLHRSRDSEFCAASYRAGRRVFVDIRARNDRSN